ncbi:MAG: response regulator [Chloroflexota bacterium]
MPDEAPSRILVIDDNPQNVALIRAQLERAGYAVSAATSGRPGIDIALAQPPDLILLDIIMPGLDGYEVCARLKAADLTRAVPIVMLTSLSDRADKIHALEVGADDFLSKPVDRAELLARARSLIRMKHLYDELVRSGDEVARQAELLAAEKSRVEAILYSMGDGVITTDCERRLTLLNPAAERICGVDFEAVLGGEWADALGIRDATGHALGEHLNPIQQVLRTGRQLEPCELTVWRPNGTPISISLAAAPVRRSGGATVGVVAVFRDVTRQREVERMKDEFVGLVSHELRTPLASVFGYSELLLLREELSEESRGFVETIFKECQRLTELVNDFLDLERLESGRITHHPRSLRLDEVIADVERSLKLQIGRRRLIRDFPSEPALVRADSQRLTQVLINLLSNALKYSPNDGDVTIRVRTDDDAVVVSVQDTGLGLPPEAMDRLFTKFYRIERPEHQKISGTGLGLSICRHLVEGWGGRIWAESEGLGRGSAFSLTVPRASGMAVPPAPTRQRERGRILLVKNDASLTALIRAQLTDAGYDVDSVSTGEAAIEWIHAERPATVVLDLGLAGELDGWSVLANLRSDPRYADTPVVIISGHDERTRGLALGVDDYLVKPVPAERLIESIKRVAGPRADGPILIVDDEPTLRRLVSESLRGAGFTTAEAESGDAALRFSREIRPAAVVLDLLMPEVDGFQVLEALRNDADLADVPVVVLTAKDLTGPERQILANRVTGLLRKTSGTAVELPRAIRRAIDRSRAVSGAG